MKKLLERYVIVQYIVRSFIMTLVIALGGFTVLFAILELTGLYAKIETALDLKYNSPFLMVPLWGSLVMAGLCFFVGFLMYFYKYKRNKSKSAFHATLSGIFEEK